ncbi:sugar-binding transcriptional regulator [Kocuria rhizosphaericola]|uniref:sugar-binding transcriptional regulator n=1 Tax=Kocuria rhizosphaericola TaxID=3376284 RepID=UPI0037B0EB55
MSSRTVPRGVADADRLRLMAVVSRLYHMHRVSQRQISERLGLSPARVSRLLRQAEAEGIVSTVVAVPEGLHPDLEDTVERSWAVKEVHVVDVPGPDLAPDLGRAAARLLADAMTSHVVVGFTSWSRTLQHLAFAFPAPLRTATRQVVEMLGDLGSPLQQHSAARATQAMASALGADPVFLRTPGVVTTPALRDAALADPYVQRALRLLDAVDIALVGVGPPAVHSQLQAGDGYFSPEQLAEVQAAGAVSQLNQRFLDRAGRRLETPLDELVVGSTLEQVAAAGRRVVVAGGPDKQEPLAAALRGGWVDTLVTDVTTARFLAGELPDGGLVSQVTTA